MKIMIIINIIILSIFYSSFIFERLYFYSYCNKSNKSLSNLEYPIHNNYDNSYLSEYIEENAVNNYDKNTNIKKNIL